MLQNVFPCPSQPISSNSPSCFSLSLVLLESLQTRAPQLAAAGLFLASGMQSTGGGSSPTPRKTFRCRGALPQGPLLGTSPTWCCSTRRLFTKEQYKELLQEMHTVVLCLPSPWLHCSTCFPIPFLHFQSCLLRPGWLGSKEARYHASWEPH